MDSKTQSSTDKCFFCFHQSNVRQLLPASAHCRAGGNQIVEHCLDQETVLSISRKLAGAAKHLIEGSEKCICQLSFELQSLHAIERRRKVMISAGGTDLQIREPGFMACSHLLYFVLWQDGSPSVSAAHLEDKHMLLFQTAAGNQAYTPPPLPTKVNKWVAKENLKRLAMVILLEISNYRHQSRQKVDLTFFVSWFN